MKNITADQKLKFEKEEFFSFSTEERILVSVPEKRGKLEKCVLKEKGTARYFYPNLNFRPDIEKSFLNWIRGVPYVDPLLERAELGAKRRERTLRHWFVMKLRQRFEF